MPAEVAKCFALALCEAARPGLAFLSAILALAAFGLWPAVFAIWWSDLASLAGWAVNKLTGGLLHMPVPSSNGSTLWIQAFAYILLAAAFLLLVMVTLRILLEWMLMSRIQRHCLRRYPQLQRGVESSVLGGLRDTIGPVLTFVFGGLACLLIPVLGGGLLFVLANYLNVRGLVNDAVEGLANDEQRRVFIKANRLQMAVLGVLLSVFMLIPFAGFFAPVVMGASVCHLCMRALARQATV